MSCVRWLCALSTNYDWHLLVGDETALPAATRRLEELPAGAQAIVLIQARDPEDRRDFASAATTTVQRVSHSDQLLEAVRSLNLPAGEGYAWCAAEARVVAELRRILVDEKGLLEKGRGCPP